MKDDDARRGNSALYLGKQASSIRGVSQFHSSDPSLGSSFPLFVKKSSGRVLLIHFLEVVLMFKSSVVLSLVESVESVLKTDRLAVVSCVRIS
jgi:hypothetical protein